MGQYYKPIVLAPKSENRNSEVILAWMYSHDYDNGLKLMEHSWVGNDFVEAFEVLISPGGEFYNQRVVWAGDYADEEPEGDTLFSRAENDHIRMHPAGVPSGRYVVNHTKCLFVDKQNIPSNDTWGDGTPMKIHPLPLLTCEGNGRGGGDFHGNDPKELIGSWARDVITIEENRPEGVYAELEFNLMEDR